MKLFQYWDTGSPPDDVAGWIDGFRAKNPDLRHLLYHRDGANWFIGKHIGERERRAFESLAVPAMQADYFRLCALWAKGGFWADADLCCNRPLLAIRSEAPYGLIAMSFNRLQNHLLFTCEAGNPFFRAAVELATLNIEERLQSTAYQVTGPWLLNLLWVIVDPLGAGEDDALGRDPKLQQTPKAAAVAALYPGAGEAFLRMTRRHTIWCNQWAKSQPAAYKQGLPSSWRSWSGPVYVDECASV